MRTLRDIEPGETVYKIAEKEEEVTGLAALFSGLFTNRQVNRNGSWNRNRNSQDGTGAPDFGNTDPGSMSGPGGSSGRPDGGSRGN